MLKKLKLSKSGYYDYLRRKPCKQKIRKARITIRIKEIHKKSKEIIRCFQNNQNTSKVKEKNQ